MKEERRAGREGRMERGREGELAALPPDSHMDSGSLGTTGLKSPSVSTVTPGCV